MNERIRKLAEQAGITPGIMGLNRFTYFDPEKFAQSIVRECMDIACSVGDSTEPDDFALDSCYEIEQRIKEHFGVKE